MLSVFMLLIVITLSGFDCISILDLISESCENAKTTSNSEKSKTPVETENGLTSLINVFMSNKMRREGEREGERERGRERGREGDRLVEGEGNREGKKKGR
jgi:hypothetical protein